MRLSELAKETKPLEVIYRAGSAEFRIQIEYFTQAVTLSFLKELEAAEGTEKLVYQITKVVKSWDLQDDDDKVIPVTAEAIENSGVPIFLLTSILSAIAGDRFIPDDAKNG